MQVKASLFSLFGRVGRLGAISSVTESEIVGELLTRNYTTGQVTEPVTPTITRAEAIRYAVNKGLDSYGRPRNAVTLTYLPTLDFNTIVNFCTTWANWYLSGTQKAESYYMSGLGGLRGRNLRGLGEFVPGVLPGLEPAPAPGQSGWALLITFLGTAITTYGQYLLAKQQMANAGYSLNPLTSAQYSAYSQLHPYEPAPKEGTPTWVWVAGGVAAVYLLTQRKTA